MVNAVRIHHIPHGAIHLPWWAWAIILVIGVVAGVARAKRRRRAR